jgi:SHS2 domain-containing protein
MKLCKEIIPLTTIHRTMKSYEILDHTADILLKSYGPSLAEAFEHAAVGMFDQIYLTTDVKPIGEFQVDLQNDDIEQLLVEWLSELLYIHETQKVVFAKFTVNLDEKNNKLVSQAYGENIDPEKHVIANEIKAVTYHMLEIGQEDGTYFVKVLLDI